MQQQRNQRTKTMANPTYKNVNKRIAEFGVEVVNGGGYFYFAILDGFADDTVVPASVYVPRLSGLTLGGWADHVAAAN